jgi:hypothetical protein
MTHDNGDHCKSRWRLAALAGPQREHREAKVVMKIMRLLPWFVWVYLSSAGAGQCSTNQWTFKGIITTGLSDGPYQTGLPYSVFFDVDTSRLSTTTSGLYFPISGYGFQVGVSCFIAGSLGSGVLVANDQPRSGGGSFDGIIFSMFDEQSGFPSGALFDGAAYGITLVNSSTGPVANPFSNTSFPSTLDLNQFSQRNMAVYFQDGPVRGSVDSLYLNGVLISQVPEPTISSLFVLGCVLVGLSTRIITRNKRKRVRP